MRNQRNEPRIDRVQLQARIAEEAEITRHEDLGHTYDENRNSRAHRAQAPANPGHAATGFSGTAPSRAEIQRPRAELARPAESPQRKGQQAAGGPCVPVVQVTIAHVSKEAAEAGRIREDENPPCPALALLQRKQGKP